MWKYIIKLCNFLYIVALLNSSIIFFDTLNKKNVFLWKMLNINHFYKNSKKI